MKRHVAFLTVAVIGLVFFSTNITVSTVLAVPGGQDETREKKVIQTTTDERGFQKELTEVDMMYQTAKQFMSASQWQPAVAELQRVVGLERHRIPAWRDLAKCFDQLKDPVKAADAYRQASTVQPEDLSLLSLLGYAELRAQELENAIGTYNRMIELDSLNYDANVHLGFVFQRQKDHERAISHYMKALKSNPEDVPTMGSIAKIYSDMGEEQKAVEMYEKAVEYASTEQKANILSKLGAAYISDKKFEKSIAVFEELTVVNPDNPAHLYNLGISYMQLKKFSEAIPPLMKVIELKPEFIGAYQQLGVSYNESAKYNSAISTIKKGLDMAPGNAGLYVTWATSLEKMKLFDDAIAILQKAVNDPQYGSYAKKQIDRQIKLKDREQKIKDQQM